MLQTASTESLYLVTSLNITKQDSTVEQLSKSHSTIPILVL